MTSTTEQNLTEELEDKYFNDMVDAGNAKCEDCGEWDLATNCDYDDDTGLHTNCSLCVKSCVDCKRTEDQLDANDIELEYKETDFATCLDCKDERISHMKDKCDTCNDVIGGHALYVGTIGYKICYDCDVNGENAEEPQRVFESDADYKARTE